MCIRDRWGYRQPGDDPFRWGGDTMIEAPRTLLDPGVWPVAVATP